MALNFPANPEDGQIFNKYIYNATKNTWDINVSISSGELELDELTDVSIDTPEEGQALIFDGTEWKNLELEIPESGVDINESLKAIMFFGGSS